MPHAVRCPLHDAWCLCWVALWAVYYHALATACGPSHAVSRSHSCVAQGAPRLLADEEQLRVVDDLDRALCDLRRDVKRLPGANSTESCSRLKRAHRASHPSRSALKALLPIPAQHGIRPSAVSRTARISRTARSKGGLRRLEAGRSACVVALSHCVVGALQCCTFCCTLQSCTPGRRRSASARGRSCPWGRSRRSARWRPSWRSTASCSTRRSVQHAGDMLPSATGTRKQDVRQMT